MIEKHSQLHEGDNNLSVSSGDPEVAKDVSEAVLSIPASIHKVVPRLHDEITSLCRNK